MQVGRAGPAESWSYQPKRLQQWTGYGDIGRGLLPAARALK